MPRRYSLMVAGAVVALAAAAPLHAQGLSHNDRGGGPHKSKPPSSNPLPGPASGASPLSWVDDASLLAPGTMSLTISAMRWSGTDLSEVDFPIVEASYGVTRRLQIGASVPRVVGSADGPVGGIGTSYVSGKISILDDTDVKVAVSPIVEILGAGAVQALPAGESRYRVGVPVSLEVSQGPARMFAATGIFSRGAWFAGGGAGFQASPRVGLSMSFTRSWAPTDIAGVNRDRRELSGGVSYFAKPQIGIYGSVGHTIATTDENGAGMTVSGGVSFYLNTRVTK
jgi:hypothetical protein